jgi:GNAT superfamily N-acetyltransferase
MPPHTAVTSPLSWAVEEACINGFPALRTALLGGWLLRFSGSTRRTANSVTPLPNFAGDIDELITGCEAMYRWRGRQTIFRIPSFLDQAADRALAARGYTDEAESCVIHGPIAPVAVAAAGLSPGEVRLHDAPTAEWFAAMARLQGQTTEQHAVYRQILQSLLLPAAFAEATLGGETVAMAFAVLHRGLVCCESVVTAEARRRQGHARRVLAALAGWARERGATGACLQVEADNTAGRTLYAAIGMTTELHRYHYRRQPD